MSLWDLMSCAQCGHPRYAHATIDTKQGKRQIHCKRCECQTYVEPIEPPPYKPGSIKISIPT